MYLHSMDSHFLGTISIHSSVHYLLQMHKSIHSKGMRDDAPSPVRANVHFEPRERKYPYPRDNRESSPIAASVSSRSELH